MSLHMQITVARLPAHGVSFVVPPAAKRFVSEAFKEERRASFVLDDVPYSVWSFSKERVAKLEQLARQYNYKLELLVP